MLISSATLRLIWTAVEEMSPRDLLTFSDTALVRTLLQHISQKILLSGEEVGVLYSYLGERMALIRDIAESRLLERDFFVAPSLIPISEAVEAVGIS
jgi:hypothetical protein